MDGDTQASGASKRPKRPTLKTVAEATGFAVTTVSRALADDPRIAKTTRERVAAAAREIGYVPDRAAQRLRTGRTKVVSLLVNPHHEFLGFTDVLLNGLTDAFRGTGYHITITPDFIEGDRVAAVDNIVRNRLADGVIFSRTECFDPRVRAMLEADFPFVTHGRTDFGTPHPYVDFDNEAFARMAVEHLVSKGRTRIAMICPDPRFTFSQHLRYGFMAAVREAGVDYVLPEDVTLDSASETISGWLMSEIASDAPPDGYICVGEVIALATIAALTDSGQDIGRDVDLFAKRASPIFDLMRPRIDSVFENLQTTGRTIGEMLLRRMEGEPAEALQKILAPEAVCPDEARRVALHRP